jgi:cytochrome c peroxidase
MKITIARGVATGAARREASSRSEQPACQPRHFAEKPAKQAYFPTEGSRGRSALAERRAQKGFDYAVCLKFRLRGRHSHRGDMLKRSASPVWVGACLCWVAIGIATTVAAQSSDSPAAPWRPLFQRPAGLPPAPGDNAMTPERVALGAHLFADRRLSGNGERSCASCHRPERAFADGRRRARGLSGSNLRRNTPSLWNLAWSKHYFWDGRAPTLEAQVRTPIEAPDEMGGDWPTILARLEADADLAARFRAIFPGEPPISRETVVEALAAYVRSLVSPPTRFDAWIEGDARALDAAEVRGFRLFTGKAGCVLCHAGWRFTDDRFHDIGLRGKDPGRGAVPGGTPGLGAFKTPSLREVVHTAPYMHDGSLPDLTAVIAHYTGGFARRPSLAPNMSRSLRLSARDKADLVAFLRTLSSETARTRR